MNPTEEQLRAIDLFRTGGNLAIEAGAGTGKTSTLVMLAEAAGVNRRGQYVAFNKALVTDSAGKFPLTVACNTAHSLAFRAVGRHYSHRLNAGRVPGYVLAQRMGQEAVLITDFTGEERRLAPGFVANHVMKAITGFCRTADMALGTSHFPYIDGLDAPDPTTGRRTYRTNNELSQRLLPVAQRAWEDLNQKYGGLPFTHDHYLKMWQLADPRIDADYVLFDESQDANPVIAAIIANQTRSQLVYVGDSQQEIYAFTGAVNALAQVQVENRTYLSQSFRFGQAIADEANVVLDKLDAELRLTGNPAISSSVGSVSLPKAILTRTNAAGITRLLSLQALGREAHFLGGSADVLGFARAADELMATGHTGHPDLALFDSWEAVQAYVNDANEDGADLKLMVKLVDTFGTEAIVTGLSKMPPENKADIVISTAHKSKGRQWPTVQLASDFKRERKPGETVDPESSKAELRLLYVALTRAQERLDMDALASDDEAGEEGEIRES